jgi:Transposase, Mutator family
VRVASRLVVSLAREWACRSAIAGSESSVLRIQREEHRDDRRGQDEVQELLGKVLVDEHADVLRQAVCWLAEQLMEAEVTVAAGAGYGGRSPDRTARRNGYRERVWDTRVRSIELAIPRLRPESYFPSFLEPRQRSEQALVAVVQEAYVNGVSTRKVDRLVEALGLAGVPRTPSRGCAAGWMSRSKPSGSGPWRAPTPTCGWTPRLRRCGLVGGWSTAAWWSPTVSTRPGSGRSSAWTLARPRPRHSGGNSYAA